MQLNGLTLVGYDHTGANATFLLDCTFEQALALDGEELRVTDGDGTDIAVFGGYHLTGLELDSTAPSDRTRASFSKRLEPETEAELNALEGNLEIAKGDIKRVESKAVAAQATADTATGLAGSNSESIDVYGTAIEEIVTTQSDEILPALEVYGRAIEELANPSGGE